MQKGIYNHETGQQDIVDLTPEEIAEVEASAAAALAKQEALEAKAAERLAVLAKLDLTPEEAAALLS